MIYQKYQFITFLCTFMTNSTSITMNEQDRQEIIRDAQSYYRDDKALINHSYLEHASAEELNELKLMKKMEIRR